MKTLPSAVAQGNRARVAVAGLFAVALVLSAASARAEDASGANTSNPISPVEEFSQQLEAFQRSVPDLKQSNPRTRPALSTASPTLKKPAPKSTNCARRFPGC